MNTETSAGHAANALGHPFQNAEFPSHLYQPLRRIARSLLRKERRDSSLEATELVHQTILSKLLGKAISVSEADYFLSVAVRGMKQIIIDRGRRRRIREQAQSGFRAATSSCLPELAVMIRHELLSFAKTDPRAARIIDFRVLHNHTWEEIAQLENMSVRAVRADYTFAIAWLRSRFAR